MFHSQRLASRDNVSCVTLAVQLEVYPESPCSLQLPLRKGSLLQRAVTREKKSHTASLCTSRDLDDKAIRGERAGRKVITQNVPPLKVVSMCRCSVLGGCLGTHPPS